MAFSSAIFGIVGKVTQLALTGDAMGPAINDITTAYCHDCQGIGSVTCKYCKGFAKVRVTQQLFNFNNFEMVDFDPMFGFTGKHSQGTTIPCPICKGHDNKSYKWDVDLDRAGKYDNFQGGERKKMEQVGYEGEHFQGQINHKDFDIYKAANASEQTGQPLSDNVLRDKRFMHDYLHSGFAKWMTLFEKDPSRRPHKDIWVEQHSDPLRRYIDEDEDEDDVLRRGEIESSWLGWEYKGFSKEEIAAFQPGAVLNRKMRLRGEHGVYHKEYVKQVLGRPYWVDGMLDWFDPLGFMEEVAAGELDDGTRTQEEAYEAFVGRNLPYSHHKMAPGLVPCGECDGHGTARRDLVPFPLGNGVSYQVTAYKSHGQWEDFANNYRAADSTSAAEFNEAQNLRASGRGSGKFRPARELWRAVYSGDLDAEIKDRMKDQFEVLHDVMFRHKEHMAMKLMMSQKLGDAAGARGRAELSTPASIAKKEHEAKVKKFKAEVVRVAREGTADERKQMNEKLAGWGLQIASAPASAALARTYAVKANEAEEAARRERAAAAARREAARKNPGQLPSEGLPAPASQFRVPVGMAWRGGVPVWQESFSDEHFIPSDMPDWDNPRKWELVKYTVKQPDGTQVEEELLRRKDVKDLMRRRKNDGGYLDKHRHAEDGEDWRPYNVKVNPATGASEWDQNFSAADIAARGGLSRFYFDPKFQDSWHLGMLQDNYYELTGQAGRMEGHLDSYKVPTWHLKEGPGGVWNRGDLAQRRREKPEHYEEDFRRTVVNPAKSEFLDEERWLFKKRINPADHPRDRFLLKEVQHNVELVNKELAQFGFKGAEDRDALKIRDLQRRLKFHQDKILREERRAAVKEARANEDPDFDFHSSDEDEADEDPQDKYKPIFKWPMHKDKKVTYKGKRILLDSDEDDEAEEVVEEEDPETAGVQEGAFSMNMEDPLYDVPGGTKNERKRPPSEADSEDDDQELLGVDWPEQAAQRNDAFPWGIYERRLKLPFERTGDWMMLEEELDNTKLLNVITNTKSEKRDPRLVRPSFRTLFPDVAEEGWHLEKEYWQKWYNTDRHYPASDDPEKMARREAAFVKLVEEQDEGVTPEQFYYRRLHEIRDDLEGNRIENLGMRKLTTSLRPIQRSDKTTVDLRTEKVTQTIHDKTQAKRSKWRQGTLKDPVN
mmetsp:Transcript_27433/g.87912  ORF Transcript_27433/g.87912 Transcript_27433/m.87912 type:complete len:1170 (-) Transcript_27433:34-3543(-)